MKITIESTSKMVELNRIPARIWEGHTDSGIPVHCYVTLVAVSAGERQEEFERELSETRAPSAQVEADSAADDLMSRTLTCEFCSHPSQLLCDGRLPVGDTGHTRSCDKRMCRKCATRPVALVTESHEGRRRGNTRDLCPDCRKAGREVF